MTNRSRTMEIQILPLSLADILNKAPGKPYIHKFSVLTSWFVLRTYIIIKTICFSELKAELRIAYHLIKNRGWIFQSRLVAILMFVPFSNDWTIIQPLKWIQHTWKPYFWHQDYKNQVISYWVMAISILAVCMVAIVEICKLVPMGHIVTGNISILL